MPATIRIRSCLPAPLFVFQIQIEFKASTAVVSTRPMPVSDPGMTTGQVGRRALRKELLSVPVAEGFHWRVEYASVYVSEREAK